MRRDRQKSGVLENIRVYNAEIICRKRKIRFISPGERKLIVCSITRVDLCELYAQLFSVDFNFKLLRSTGGKADGESQDQRENNSFLQKIVLRS